MDSEHGAASGRRSRLPPLPPPPPGRRPPARALLSRLAEAPPPPDFVPDNETVHVDTRQSRVALVLPAARTVAALAVLLTTGALAAMLLAAALTAWWARTRMRRSARTCLAVGGAVALLLGWLSSSPGTWLVAAVGVLAWLADDVLDWWSDRLVVTDKRVYRRYGWVTQHAPSMALASAVFVDVSVNPLDKLVGCGTLRFDSAAQRDAPLARFSLVPDVRSVHATVLRLRASAFKPYG